MKWLSNLVERKPKIVALNLALLLVVVSIGAYFSTRSTPSASEIGQVSNQASGTYCTAGEPAITCDPAAGKYSGSAVSNTVVTSILAPSPSPSPSVEPSVAPSPPLVPANLTFTKSVDKASAMSGDVLTYTITVKNTSTSSASTVKINDLLVSNVTFVSASDGGTPQGSTIVWFLPSISGGATKTLTLQALE